MKDCATDHRDDHPKAWTALSNHRNNWSSNLRGLFESDPARSRTFSARAGNLYLDYSKSHLNEEIRRLLTRLAKERNLNSAIQGLINGEIVNKSENRPALHTLLRTPANTFAANDQLLTRHRQVLDCQANMKKLVEKVHCHEWTGYTGKPISHIVNIGIGGSDLGPRMVTQALCDYRIEGITVSFVANIDPSELLNELTTLSAETTLFIVASKSFTTQETLANAQTARKWLLSKGCPVGKLQEHFVGVSSNIEKAVAFGISQENIFPLWDWVGGRYSLWSAIGLPIALAIGWNNFEALLQGASEMDQHFAGTPFEKNMPVLMALITFWYSQFWEASSQAILPYSHDLRSFPMFLQQMDMESLGKSVDQQGTPLDYSTGMVIWGTEESNGQHSFHQLLLQGSRRTPVDFIAFAQPNNELFDQHRQLLAACLSQGQALLQGKNLSQAKQELLQCGLNEADANAIAPHKVIAGDCPSNTLLIDKLTPYNLGSLIALYEHKIFTLSVLLDINAFDQWGVELGKQLGKQTYQALKDGQIPEQWDSSTAELVRQIQKSTP